MGDDDALDIGGDDVTGADGGSKKGRKISGFLPNLLKFAAIGLGALIFIVTVAVITYKILNSRGEAQTVPDPTSEYIGTRPQFSTFTLIGQLNTRTRDRTHTVVVDMLIEYDLNNNAAQTELTGRVNQLRDFTRNYFASRYFDELSPENEEKLKMEIRESLNNRYLDTAKVRGILFNKLDIMEI
jgi:flagellar FliL protein